MNVFSVEHLSYQYSTTPLLRNINIEIPAGDFLFLVGPNGCGKTTFIRLLSGFLRPQQGSVRFRGTPVKDLHPSKYSKEVALVPQKETVVFPFSVRAMVTLGRYTYTRGFGFETEEDHRHVREAMHMMGIDRYAEKNIMELSGGEFHRVIIARALAQDTPVLLLDEPNAHLDLQYQIDLFDLLRSLNSMNKLTIICITHDLNLAALYGTRVAVLKHGVLACIGSPREVLTSELIQETFGIQARVDIDDNGIPRMNIMPRRGDHPEKKSEKFQT